MRTQSLRRLSRVLRQDGRPAGRASPGVLVLVAAVLVAIGLLLGLVLSPAAPPDPVDDSQVPDLVEVEADAFYDERQVQLSIDLGPKRRILAPASGVVTAFACEPGATIESGASPLSLNGMPLIALATSIPLWRDVAAGTSGTDVEALQQELKRLGFDVDDTGQYDTATQRVVAELINGTGARTSESTLSLASVLWLPDRSPKVASCDTDLGASVGRGTPLASLEPKVEAVAVSGQPSSLVTGDRLLVVDDVEVPVDETGTVADTSDLGSLAVTDAFTRFRRTDGEIPVQATYMLASPLPVASLPPSAIVVESDSIACVLAKDRSVHYVRVIASVVGRSLVTWVTRNGAPSETAPPQSVYIDPGEGQRCT